MLNPTCSENIADRVVSVQQVLSTASALWITRSFLALGVLLRVRQYLFNRSLWLDESLLVLNLLRRSPAELLQPLSYHQGAPLGFLMAEKAVTHFFGSGELALRLIPFLAGTASLFLFAELAKRFLVPAEFPLL